MEKQNIHLFEALFSALYVDSPVPTKNTVKSWLYVGDALTSSTGQSGKWCVFRTAKEIDSLWLKVKKAIKQKKLKCAKVSTKSSVRNEQYVICVYTEDWSDAEDLMRVREVLRDLGVTERISYKRDLETIAKVYDVPQEWFVHS